MSNNFVKRKGRLVDNTDIPLTDFKIKILGSDSVNTISASLDFLTGLPFYWPSTSSRCLRYYISADKRSPVEEYYSLTELLGLSRKRLRDIAKKNFSAAAGVDYIAFYGYDAISKGNLYVYVDKIKTCLIENVRYAVKNKTSKNEILKFYNYQEVPEIIRNKNSMGENDFYFAIGDGNYLYGQVHTIDTSKREFQILYVLYDEYNWDEDVTYFIKTDTKNSSYWFIVETAAFKKLEKEGLAKPFLEFFVDTCTVSY